MAFTGSPTIVQISDRKLLITGISLAALAVGTIACGNTDQVLPMGFVRLPLSFQPAPYSRPDGTINLPQSIEITVNPNSAVATAIPIEILKTGTDSSSFVATLTNNHGSIASPNLEIWIEWH